MHTAVIFYIIILYFWSWDLHCFFPLVPLHFLHQQSCAFTKLQSFVAVCKQINQEQFCHYTVSGISWWMTITYMHTFFQLLLVISYDPWNFLRHFYCSTYNTCVPTSSHYHNTGNDTSATIAQSCKFHAHKPQIMLSQLPPLVLLAC